MNLSREQRLRILDEQIKIQNSFRKSLAKAKIDQPVPDTQQLQTYLINQEDTPALQKMPGEDDDDYNARLEQWKIDNETALNEFYDKQREIFRKHLSEIISSTNQIGQLMSNSDIVNPDTVIVFNKYWVRIKRSLEKNFTALSFNDLKTFLAKVIDSIQNEGDIEGALNDMKIDNNAEKFKQIIDTVNATNSQVKNIISENKLEAIVYSISQLNIVSQQKMNSIIDTLKKNNLSTDEKLVTIVEKLEKINEPDNEKLQSIIDKLNSFNPANQDMMTPREDSKVAPIDENDIELDIDFNSPEVFEQLLNLVLIEYENAVEDKPELMPQTVYDIVSTEAQGILNNFDYDIPQSSNGFMTEEDKLREIVRPIIEYYINEIENGDIDIGVNDPVISRDTSRVYLSTPAKLKEGTLRTEVAQLNQYNDELNRKPFSKDEIISAIEREKKSKDKKVDVPKVFKNSYQNINLEKNAPLKEILDNLKSKLTKEEFTNLTNLPGYSNIVRLLSEPIKEYKNKLISEGLTRDEVDNRTVPIFGVGQSQYIGLNRKKLVPIMFGRYLIDKNKLHNQNLLHVFHQSGNNVKYFKATYISDNLKQLINQIIQRKSFNHNIYSSLSEDEKDLVKRLLDKSGLTKQFGIKIESGKYDDAKKLYKDLKEQYLIISSEIDEGNNNPMLQRKLNKIVKELKQVITHLSKVGEISKRDATNMILSL